MNNISEHITYNEATKSITAQRLDIKNEPTPEQLVNMKHWANTIFEPLREVLGNKAIGLASFFRSFLLNTAIGGSPSSQHCNGEAGDIDADKYNNGITNRMIFDFIKDNCDFDQMIWEFGTDEEPAWVHVSTKRDGDNRNQILVAYKELGKTNYKYYKAA